MSSRRRAARHAGAAAAGRPSPSGGSAPPSAHHSYPATYDTAQRVTVSGVVQLVRFANPHVHIVLEAPWRPRRGRRGGDGALEEPIPIFQERGQRAGRPAPGGPRGPPGRRGGGHRR